MVGRQALTKDNRKYQGRRGFVTSDKNQKIIDDEKYIANFKRHGEKTRGPKMSIYSQSQETAADRLPN